MIQNNYNIKRDSPVRWSLMVIMLDPCWNERVSAQPFFYYNYSCCPCPNIFIWRGVYLDQPATERLWILTLVRMMGHHLTYPLVPAVIQHNDHQTLPHRWVSFNVIIMQGTVVKLWSVLREDGRSYSDSAFIYGCVTFSVVSRLEWHITSIHTLTKKINVVEVSKNIK